MSKFELPDEPTKANPYRLRKLLLFSNPKVGKTSLCRKLKNALIIDLEGKAETFEGEDSYVINVPELATENKLKPWQMVVKIAKELESTDKSYDYIVIDSVTELEYLANAAAVAKYRASLKGKEFKPDDITEMEYGQGYGKLERTFFRLANKLMRHAKKGEIYLGHSTKTSEVYGGEVINARDIDLTKKVRKRLTKDVDAVGYMYAERNENEDGYLENVVTFERSALDSVTGAAPIHISNKKIVISEGTSEDGIVKAHWDKIFKDYQE